MAEYGFIAMIVAGVALNTNVVANTLIGHQANWLKHVKLSQE